MINLAKVLIAIFANLALNTTKKYLIQCLGLIMLKIEKHVVNVVFISVHIVIKIVVFATHRMTLYISLY